MSGDHAALYAALYGPPSADNMVHALPDTGDALAAALAYLARDPSVAVCDMLLLRLDGLRQHLLRLRAVLLLAEGGPPDA